jgi:hypothetical protein
MLTGRKASLLRGFGRISGCTRLLLVAYFALWFMAYPFDTVSRELNNVDGTTHHNRILSGLTLDEQLNEIDGFKVFPKRAVLVRHKDMYGIGSTCATNLISEVFINILRHSYVGMGSRRVIMVSNVGKPKLTVHVLAAEKPNCGNLRRLTGGNHFANECPERAVQCHDALKYGVSRKPLHRLKNLGSGNKASARVKPVCTDGSNHLISACGYLAGLVYRHIHVLVDGGCMAIGPHIHDCIFGDENNRGSMTDLCNGSTIEDQDEPKYYRETRDEMFSTTGVLRASDGTAWLVHGNDLDVSWDGKVWYHLLGSRCVKNYKSIKIQIPNGR